jgi:hypothetical protein
LLIVQRSVAVDPAGTPVTAVPGEDGVVTEAVPDITVQAPVPTVGVLAVILKVPLLQLNLSTPAFDTVGCWKLVNTTSSVDTAQIPLVIVQRRVAVDPAANPVTVELNSVGVVTVAVPEITVHAPEPVVGLFPARVKLETLQSD